MRWKIVIAVGVLAAFIIWYSQPEPEWLFPEEFQRWHTANGAAEMTAEQQYEEGSRLYSENHFSEAEKWYLLSERNGSARAKNGLAVLYARGFGESQGVMQDIPRAAELFQLAAISGDMLAQYNASVLLVTAFGRYDKTPYSRDDALTWLQSAARQGYAPAVELHERMRNPSFLEGLANLGKVGVTLLTGHGSPTSSRQDHSPETLEKPWLRQKPWSAPFSGAPLLYAGKKPADAPLSINRGGKMKLIRLDSGWNARQVGMFKNMELRSYMRGFGGLNRQARVFGKLNPEKSLDDMASPDVWQSAWVRSTLFSYCTALLGEPIDSSNFSEKTGLGINPNGYIIPAFQSHQQWVEKHSGKLGLTPEEMAGKGMSITPLGVLYNPGALLYYLE